jgi:copper oxidase (laccase) domain-containing protein
VSEAVLAEFAGIPGARAGTRNLDLPAVARHQLGAAGVDAVHDTGICTICSDAFFSHRRDGGVTGRQAGVVWRV